MIDFRVFFFFRFFLSQFFVAVFFFLFLCNQLPITEITFTANGVIIRSHGYFIIVRLGDEHATMRPCDINIIRMPWNNAIIE